MSPNETCFIGGLTDFRTVLITSSVDIRQFHQDEVTYGFFTHANVRRSCIFGKANAVGVCRRCSEDAPDPFVGQFVEAVAGILPEVGS